MKGGRSGRRQYGALPIRVAADGAVEVMLITSRETRRWVIPKGWPMKGCSHVQAALIEAYEEAGVQGRAIGTGKAGSYSYSKVQRSGSATTLHVTVFLALVEAELEEWPEQTERERVWLSPSEAAALVAEPKLAKLIRRLPRLVRTARIEFISETSLGVQMANPASAE